MRDNKIQMMTMDAMFIGIIVILTFFWGFIPGPFAAITIVMIPVIVGAYVGGWKRGLIYGIAFGISSWAKALTGAMSPLDFLFQNPIIAILPRAIFGLLAGIAMDYIKKIEQKKLQYTVIVFASFALTMIHSILALTTLGLLGGTTMDLSEMNVTNYWVLMGIILGSSALIEAAVSTVVCPALIGAIDVYFRRANHAGNTNNIVSEEKKKK